MAYNAVCLLYKVVERLDAKHKALQRRRIVLCEHLVEDGRNVHRGEGVASCLYGLTMTIAPRGNAMLGLRLPANDAADRLPPLSLPWLHCSMNAFPVSLSLSSILATKSPSNVPKVRHTVTRTVPSTALDAPQHLVIVTLLPATPYPSPPGTKPESGT